MAQEKKFVEEITSMEEDFAQWYTDVVKKAELTGYTQLKGFMVIKPAGYAIWENIRNELDRRFKETGVENVYLPCLIPEGLLQKEKDHVEGFAPEVAWVTHGGAQELEERMCVRPTSETLFSDFYSRDVHSYRDLPKVYNQWCSVLRWEKTTRPFLRSREFLWQEGHTVHATAQEAQERTEQNDGKALQCGTSHNFGDGFAKAFEIRYVGKENTLEYCHQTSWGMTTRMIGAIIMVHGDNSGLKLPPRVAPVQAMVIPIQQKKGNVLEKAQELKAALVGAGIRAKLDDTDKSPGFKFSEQEMRGIPVRLEIGPKDIEKGQCVIVRRDTREKIVAPLSEAASMVQDTLEKIQKDMFESAKARLESMTYDAVTREEFEETAQTKPGFIRAMWCGSQTCEEEIKDQLGGVTSRCIPFHQEHLADTCVWCGKPAKAMVCWGRAY